MKTIAYGLLIAACLGGGFGLGVWLFPSHGFFTTVDWHGRFHGGVIYEGSLLRGWGAPEWTGVTANDKISVVRIRLPYKARRSSLQLVIEIMEMGNPQTDGISVSVNGYDLGRAESAEKSISSQRHFLIPESVAWGSETFYIQFKSEEERAFELRELWLRDVASLHNGRGHVDKCNERTVSGWAVADGLGAPVRVLVDGNQVSWVSPSVKRQDLARLGLPATAGYVYQWPEPLPEAKTIRVTLPDGQDLAGSPCNL